MKLNNFCSIFLGSKGERQVNMVIQDLLREASRGSRRRAQLDFLTIRIFHPSFRKASQSSVVALMMKKLVVGVIKQTMWWAGLGQTAALPM